MSYNISEIIGVVPHPIEEISFQVWFKNYYVHIVNLMDIFNQELSSIEPFCNNRKLQNPSKIYYQTQERTELAQYIRTNGNILGKIQTAVY